MAVFLLILLAGYYIISVSYTNSIIGGLENIKEHPFPVAIAAGKMETNSRELRLTVERLCTDRTIDTLDEVKRGLAENLHRILYMKQCACLEQQRRIPCMSETRMWIVRRQKMPEFHVSPLHGVFEVRSFL